MSRPAPGLRRSRRRWLPALAVLTLAGCGGGGSSAPAEAPQPQEVPSSATADSQSYVAFVASLAPSETAEPMRLGNLQPPTRDDEEPQESQ